MQQIGKRKAKIGKVFSKEHDFVKKEKVIADIEFVESQVRIITLSRNYWKWRV